MGKIIAFRGQGFIGMIVNNWRYTFCLSGQGLFGVIINLRGQDYLQHLLNVHVQQYENVRIEIVLKQFYVSGN